MTNTGPVMYLATDDLSHVVAQPNTLIIGDPGCGKSALVKCLVKRSRAIAGHGHWTGIVDPRGEYGPLAEALGLDTARLQPGGTERLNPLDAGPGASLLGAQEVTARRAALCRALVGSVLGRGSRRPRGRSSRGRGRCPTHHSDGTPAPAGRCRHPAGGPYGRDGRALWAQRVRDVVRPPRGPSRPGQDLGAGSTRHV